jgi:hypothetical protein
MWSARWEQQEWPACVRSTVSNVATFVCTAYCLYMREQHSMCDWQDPANAFRHKHWGPATTRNARSAVVACPSQSLTKTRCACLQIFDLETKYLEGCNPNANALKGALHTLTAAPAQQLACTAGLHCMKLASLLAPQLFLLEACNAQVCSSTHMLHLGWSPCTVCV